MILEILGYTLIGLVALIFAVMFARDFVVKRMSEAYELGWKMHTLAGQIGPVAMDQILRDAGIDPADLPFGDVA